MVDSKKNVFEKLGLLWKRLRLVGGQSIKKTPLIALFTLTAASLDLLSVALVAPFVSLMMGNANGIPQRLSTFLGSDPIKTLSIMLVVVFTVKAVATFVLQGKISRLTESVRADVMVRLLRAYQDRPYRFHLNHSSSELVNRLIWYSQAFASNFLGSLLRIFSDGLVFLALGCLIAYANPMASLLLVMVFGFVGVVVYRTTRVRLGRMVERTARAMSDATHSGNQAIGGLREVRVLGCEEYFVARLERPAKELVESVTGSNVISLVPRQAMELGMIFFLVGLVAFSRMGGETAAQLVPLLGMIGAAAVRLMPASTALLLNFSLVRANHFYLSVLANDLSPYDSAGPHSTKSVVAEKRIAASQADITPPSFQSLQGKNLSFSYNPDTAVISMLDFEIKAGETVGLAGPSGAGKSTLADLILGFLEPGGGQILVNGVDIHADPGCKAREIRRWQDMVAYIPQQPYLIDDNIRRNVALGVPDHEINDQRVRQALIDAQLGNVLSQLPKGLDTELGERGVRFSGGQRQRISIARALYHDRQFLVMDEATSALDNETEMEIVETIRALAGRKTILLIAHRESTLSVASRVITLKPKSSESPV